MKKTALMVATCGLMLALSASNAFAVAIGDSAYLGSVVPGTPSGEAAETAYVNFIIDMGLNTTADDVLVAGSSHDFTRSGNSCGACPNAVFGTKSNSDGNLTINTGDFTYLYIKAAQDGFLWYVGNVDTAFIPATVGGGGTSHYTLYGPTTTTVPDGGATLGFLGLGMLGLGYLRRREN